MAKNIYKVKWDDEKDGKLFGISIVDKPANKMQALQLSEQKEAQTEIILNKVDEKKKQLAGIVLIPEQLIYRNNEDLGEHYITFGEEEILKLSEQFFKGDYHKNSWYNHKRDEKVEGNTVVQSWTIDDPKNDKANALGLKDLVKGTWCVIMQLSDKAWEDYVETGKVKGFSIDSIMSLVKVEEVNKNKKEEVNMAKNEVKKSMIELLSDFLKFSSEDGKEKEEVKAEDKPKEDKPKEEVKAEDKPKEDEMSKEEFIAKVMKAIDEDEDVKKAIEAKYSEKEELSKKEEEEAVEMKSQLELKEKEIVELKSKLDKTPAEGREKTKVELNSNKPKTRMEAILEVIEMQEELDNKK